MIKNHNINEVVRERKILGQSYITESFESSKFKELMNNKDNLDIFKKDVLPHTHISWDSISDDNVNVNGIRQGIKDYVKSNDSYILNRLVLPTYDKQGITIYTDENNTIDIIFNHNNKDLYSVYRGIFDTNMNTKDIINDAYTSFRQKNMYINKVEDIRDYLYISSDKVDVLRTLYKMLLMSLYSLKWHHMCPFTEAGDFLMDIFWRNQHGSEIIYHVLNNIRNKNDKFECMNGKYKTKFVIKNTTKEYYFDFEVRGLSDDDIFKRIDEYVEYLYEIDSVRKIKKSFFNDYPKHMFILAKNQSFMFNKDDYDETVFDGYIPLFNFASVMFLFDKEIISNTIYQVILASIMRYLIDTNKDLIRYTVEPTSSHVKDYSNKIRKRQLNKITSIETDQTVSDETYYLAKEMISYLWEFRDNIRKFSNKFGDDGKYILRAYNNLLIIDNTIIKMADYNAPVMQKLLRNSSGYIKHQYETLKDNVEAFIDVISEMASENILLQSFFDVYNDIREQYDNLFGIYNHEDFDE